MLRDGTQRGSIRACSLSWRSGRRHRIRRNRIRSHRITRATPYFAPGRFHVDRTFLDVALESSHDASLDGVPRPGEQQAEPDQVGEDPWREQKRAPCKHGHTIHDGLPRYTPIREIMTQPPHGAESLHAAPATHP